MTTVPSDIDGKKETMKCALATGFIAESGGKVEGILSMSSKVPRPRLNRKKSQILVRVLACSISAGDIHAMSGKMIMIRPKLPYIPGTDICGEIVETTAKVKGFKEGDIVVANNGLMPVGGMAEFMVIDPANAVIKPGPIDSAQAAACSSAVTSLQAVNYCREGDRVLVLGGSGGVGSAAITLAKQVGKASFVAATSTQKEMCKLLGADEVIDYREKNWWDIKEFQDEKFDVIIDAVGGGNFYGKATKVLKTGKEKGTFLAVCGDEQHPDLSSWFKVLKYFVKLPARPLYTSARKRKYPKYVLILPSNMLEGMSRVLSLVEKEELRIQMDPTSPLTFSEDGIKNAFNIQSSGHAHGKVVVNISS